MYIYIYYIYIYTHYIQLYSLLKFVREPRHNCYSVALRLVVMLELGCGITGLNMSEPWTQWAACTFLFIWVSVFFGLSILHQYPAGIEYRPLIKSVDESSKQNMVTSSLSQCYVHTQARHLKESSVATSSHKHISCCPWNISPMGVL